MKRTTGHIFQQYVARIGKDMNMPFDSRNEQLAIFYEVIQLTSFNNKLGQPKVSNWFAWNSMAKTQIREFNATKCISASSCIEDADHDEDGPFDSACKDPKAQLQAILKGGGGIDLAFKLMKTDLNKCVKILYVAEKACWTWYTTEIKQSKSGLAYSCRLVDGWRSEKHLLGTMAPLENPEKLRYMEIPMGESIWADRALTLMWHIVMRRAWSLSKHSTPPESLANLLSDSDAKMTRAAEQLRSEHEHFLLLERAATTVDDAELLR